MKQKKVILSLLTSLSLIIACQPLNQNILKNSKKSITENNIIETKVTIKGIAQFPKPLPADFSTKATIIDIGTNATVSLIYPHDDLTFPNKTIATGLTNSSGKFTINLDISFNPQTGSVYVLEASKRIGTTGNDLMTIRTFIQWNGNDWNSITTPGIYINTKTTALTVISSLNPSSVTPSGTINKLPVVNGETQLQDINSDVTGEVISNVRNLVTSLLANNRDPINYIKYNTGLGIFSINNPAFLKTMYTVAGGGVGDGMQATSAFLPYKQVIAVDTNGNIFIADSENNRIRKVDALTGIITTVAGNGIYGYSGDGDLAISASLATPSGVAIDPSGNIFIADSSNYRIRKVDALTGIITTVAGNGTSTYSGDGEQATNASLNSPSRIFIDANENIFIIANGNNKIRKVTASTGIITTVAGNEIGGYSGDNNLATNAFLSNPLGVAIDPSGNIFIADMNNNRIRKVDALTGIITTVAGNGIYGYSGDGGQASSASLSNPSGVAIDAVGNIFIADMNNNRIRKVTVPTGIITTVVGDGYEDPNVIFGHSGRYSGDGGLATNASLHIPSGVTLDASGNIFIADWGNSRIRKVSISTGIINTVAGGGFSGLENGGFASNAYLSQPNSVAVDTKGNIFIADKWNYRIRKVTLSTGLINTVVGNGTSGFSGDGGPATNASLYAPSGVTVDASGNIFIADSTNNRIRKVDALTGIITTIASNGNYGYSGDGGPATNASINYPEGLALDTSGNIFIADMNNNRIRKVTASTGIITTVAGDGYKDSNGFGRYLGDGGPATNASLNNPSGVTIDASGNIFIADSYNNRIRKVTVSTGLITTVAGDGYGRYSGDGSQATNASLNNPSGVTIDTNRNIIIADSWNNRIRKIDALTGIITTIVGSGTQVGNGGLALSASLFYPTGLAIDPSGNIIIADCRNNRIRKVDAGN